MDVDEVEFIMIKKLFFFFNTRLWNLTYIDTLLSPYNIKLIKSSTDPSLCYLKRYNKSKDITFIITCWSYRLWMTDNRFYLFSTFFFFLKKKTKNKNLYLTTSINSEKKKMWKKKENINWRYGNMLVPHTNTHILPQLSYMVDCD